MSDDKNPLEQAVDQAMDTFVYAPIGLIFDGPALFPKLVEKGRIQVQVARMMGQMAVQMGQSEAEKRVGKAGGQLRDSLAAAGLVPQGQAPKPEPEPEPTVDTPAATEPAPKPATAKNATAKKSTPKKSAAKKSTPKKSAAKKSAASKTAASPSAASLGIADYDSLSASQVVTRLRGLAPTDLDALRAYESATRARKTILNKITQLQKR